MKKIFRHQFKWSNSLILRDIDVGAFTLEVFADSMYDCTVAKYKILQGENERKKVYICFP